MSYRYTKDIFKICVAQICQNIGWHAVQSTPLEILVDVLHRYLLELSTTIHKYSNQCGRSVPNLEDVDLSFKDLGVSVTEIEEYVNNVEPVPFVQKLYPIPVDHSSKLQHPKPGCREIQHRPEYIHEHLPLMHPELEEEDGLLSPPFEGGSKKSAMDNSGVTDGETPSPLSSPKHGVKRPGDWTNDMPSSKKMRHYVEEEGRPMREVTSVFMTPTGFISPAREGKAPEPTMPHNMDSPPSTPEQPSTPEIVVPRKESKSKDSKKDKSSKSKKDKEPSKKDSKKVKSSKKENKENTAFASEKSAATSSTSKKEHISSHKSSSKSEKSAKSSESSKQKLKSEKIKDNKEDHKKLKDHSKSIEKKSKSKTKHSSPTPSRPSKQAKSPKLPQKSIAKSPKKSSSKSPKLEKKISPTVSVKKDDYVPLVVPKVEAMKLSKLDFDDDDDNYDSPSREESPERLVIDISVEAQNRRDRESRLAGFDECIDAVIQRGQEESKMELEKSHISVNKTIDDVARGPGMRRLEPKDIYDFTDSDDSDEISSLSSYGQEDFHTPIRKDLSGSSNSDLSSDDSSKRPYHKTKRSKKSHESSKSDVFNKSPNVIVKQRAERSPSPIRLKNSIYSSDDSDFSRPASPENNFDLPHSSQKRRSHSPSPFMPSTSFSNNSSVPTKQSNQFATPPLFQSSAKGEASSRESQPLNLAKPNSSKASKSSPHEGKSNEVHGNSSTNKGEDLDYKKGKLDLSEDKDGRSKPYHKDKKEKIEKKEKEKLKKKSNKDKKEKTKIEKEPEKVESFKPKEKPPKKSEPFVKEERRGRPPKSGKKKDKEEKDDSSVPKVTLKLSSGTPALGKFVIKPSSKISGSTSTILASKVRSPSPQPLRAASSPPPSPPPPPPKANSPPPPPSPVPSPTVPPPSDPITPVAGSSLSPTGRGAHSRGRGRGRKPANQPVLTPPARTVITETLGTIVDESGNKIWICPACTRPDDGSPMIGCDECDDWYHWVCVGIVVPPKEEESWFCARCISKRQSAPIKRRRKKHRKDK